MDDELFEYTKKKVDDMLSASSASQTTKQACMAWKDAVARGENLDAVTDRLLDAVSERQTTIDSLIEFVGSDAGKRIFGEKRAAEMLAHEQERKKAGARFCDCAACKPCHELLHKFGREDADVYL